MSEIREFYNVIQFPGHYTLAGLDLHTPTIINPYLKCINTALSNNISVLDVGCGTGLVTNLFARKYPTSEFVGVDFADSINYASQFAHAHCIHNASFIKTDFLQFNSHKKYNTVICQGVLHHIPEFDTALNKLISLVEDDGYLVIGLYHPAGKILKRFLQIDYQNEVLFKDQELHPYETAHTLSDIQSKLTEFTLISKYPSRFVWINSFFNFRSGGLVTYIFKRNKHA